MEIPKAKTIEQYKIIKHIVSNFYTEKIHIELIDDITIKITDINHDTLFFRYVDNEVVLYGTTTKIATKKL